MKTFWVVAVVLWLAATVNLGLARHLAVFGAEPDFLLTAAIGCSLCLPRKGGLAVGFFAGLVSGALAGANLAHYVISRSIAGFVAAWSRGLRFELTPLAVFVTTAVVTVLGYVFFLFTAAPRGMAGFLGDTIGTAMYNGVIAMPLYALLRRVLHPTVR